MKRLFAAVLALAGAAMLAGSASARMPAVLEHAPPALLLTHTTSFNWSGYAAYDSASAFTTVTGTWDQPTATCAHGKTTYSSFWVGLDGYDSSTVEQIGTEADCVHGKPSYYAWYEMFPDYPVNLDTAQYPLAPGDTITATVNSSTGFLTISNGTAWTFSTPSLSFSSFDLSSAEWIAEAPAMCSPAHCRFLPLTNFGTVNFTGASTNAQPINYTTGWKNDAMTMVNKNGRIIKAEPGSLNGTGTGFSVTWQHS